MFKMRLYHAMGLTTYSCYWKIDEKCKELLIMHLFKPNCDLAFTKRSKEHYAENSLLFFQYDVTQMLSVLFSQQHTS